jgi:hypothetical protein
LEEEVSPAFVRSREFRPEIGIGYRRIIAVQSILAHSPQKHIIPEPTAEPIIARASVSIVAPLRACRIARKIVRIKIIVSVPTQQDIVPGSTEKGIVICTAIKIVIRTGCIIIITAQIIAPLSPVKYVLPESSENGIVTGFSK